jgi:hypothetical protein
VVQPGPGPYWSVASGGNVYGWGISYIRPAGYQHQIKAAHQVKLSFGRSLVKPHDLAEPEHVDPVGGDRCPDLEGVHAIANECHPCENRDIGRLKANRCWDALGAITQAIARRTPEL